MHWIIAVSALVFAIHGVTAEKKPVKMAAINGEDASITCDAVTGVEGEIVEWRDFIYNYDREAIMIYSSESGLNEDHEQKSRFSVSDDLRTLTISKADGDIAGQYICNVTSPDKTYVETTIKLSIFGEAQCSSSPYEATVGEEIQLECTGTSKGDVVESRWVDEDGNEVDSSNVGDFEPVRIAVLEASSELDGKTFTCERTLFGKTSTCDVTLEIKHETNMVTIEPKQAEYYIGDVIHCKANGNPKPNVVWRKSDNTQVSEGTGEAALQIEHLHDIEEYKCEATQEGVSPVTETISFKAIDINATTKKPTNAPPKDESVKGNEPVTTGGVGMAGVIGGVVAAMVIILVIVVAIYIARKKSKPKGAKPVPNKDIDAEKNDIDAKA